MINYLFLYGLAIAIFYLFFFLYKDYMNDYTRQELFKLRDRLFDYAADGNIAFDDEAYKTTRTMINGVIRFTHSITLTHWLMMTFFSSDEHRNYEKQFSAQFAVAISKLNQDQQKMVKDVLVDTHLLIANHLLKTSPLLLITIEPILILARLVDGVVKAKEVLFASYSLWKPIDAQANFIGMRAA